MKADETRKPSRTSGYVTLQDERQDVEELQLTVFHICLNVFAHEGPGRLMAHISTAISCCLTSTCSCVITATDAVYAGTSHREVAVTGANVLRKVGGRGLMCEAKGIIDIMGPDWKKLD